MKTFIFFIMLSGCAFAHDGNKPDWPLSKFLHGSLEFSEHGKLHYKMACDAQEGLCRQRARKLCEDEGTVLEIYKGGRWHIAHYKEEGVRWAEGFELIDVYCKKI